MKAAVLREGQRFPQVEYNFEIDPPKEYEKVNISHAALNHRDLWICKGQYANIKFPIILGSDGCGIWKGKEVIINPGLYWGDNEAFQSGDFRVLGLPDNGTMAEYCWVPGDYIHEKPAHLNSAEAAALPLAGVTAFRALFTRAKLKHSDKVLINGAGGGVAQLAFAMAKAIGSEVFVTTGSAEKLERLLAAGASGGVNYKEEHYVEALKKMSGRFDVILDSAAGESLSAIFPLCNYGARVVLYGGTKGRIPALSPQILFWRQVEILGSTMGSPKDFSDMLDFVSRHKLVPEVDEVFEMENIEQAIRKMEAGSQYGKIVIAIDK